MTNGIGTAIVRTLNQSKTLPHDLQSIFLKLKIIQYIKNKLINLDVLGNIKIYDPDNHNLDYLKTVVISIRGVKDVWIVRTPSVDIVFRAEWKKDEIEKKVGQLHLKLPDYTLIDLMELRKV